MAFFMMDWMSEGEKSFDLTDDALATQNLPSRGINSSHGSARVPSNNSSKVSAWKRPTSSSTRSAVRRPTLARATASASPAKLTRPSVTSPGS